MADLPVMSFQSAEAWEAWLEEHHTEPDGLWLKIAKKDSGIPSVTYAEALEVALCFGWIDGQRNKFDERCFIQKFTPRRKRSPWSQRNQDIVAKLIAAGRMREMGHREIERAKEDGRWEAAYASQRNMEVPQEFQTLLDQNPKAQANFDTLNSQNRFAVLYRITTAKKAETRQRRMADFIDRLNKGEKIL